MKVGPREASFPSVRGRRSIADLIWVANTRHGPTAHWFARASVGAPDHDHLEHSSGAIRYLVDHHVEVPPAEPTGSQLASLAALSDMVRGLATSSGAWTAGARQLLAKTRFHLDDRAVLVAEGTGWDAFIGDLMLPLIEVVRLRDRLSVCGNPACRLAFVDESKSRNRRWCDDAGCGNRTRARRYRRRHADTQQPSGPLSGPQPRPERPSEEQGLR